jgi:hypothetical protein
MLNWNPLSWVRHEPIWVVTSRTILLAYIESIGIWMKGIFSDAERFSGWVQIYLLVWNDYYLVTIRSPVCQWHRYWSGGNPPLT